MGKSEVAIELLFWKSEGTIELLLKKVKLLLEKVKLLLEREELLLKKVKVVIGSYRKR